MTETTEQVREAIRALLGATGGQLGFSAMSYWVGGPNETPHCLCMWQRGGGGLKEAVDRDRRHHAATENAQRLVKIVLLTGEELWLRDGVGKPGVTTGGAALPVFVDDSLVGAVAALDRQAGQLGEDQRSPVRSLCVEIASIEGLPLSPQTSS